MDSFCDDNINNGTSLAGALTTNTTQNDERSDDVKSNLSNISKTPLSNSNSSCSIGVGASLSCAASSSSNSSSVHLSGAKQQFMDSLSLASSSSLSHIHGFDDDDDIMSNSDRNRASFFIDSSRVSMTSDEDEVLPSLIEFILSDQPRTGGEDSDIYNDWDSGLSNYSAESQRDETESWESWTNSSTDMPMPELSLDFPYRSLRFTECQICLEMTYIRRRVCCDYQICNTCLSMYLTGKVKDGKVQIECPNDQCNVLMFREEIRHRLSVDMREKYSKFLIDANKDPYVKTCPSCSTPFQIDRARLKISKKKLKRGVEVTCTQCSLVWCFRCQAPFHTNLSCKKYKNEDEMVKRWAKERTFGQSNAQRCPKCKIFVQKMDGCDHMKCTQCETNFCYRCGDRYISVKFFGSHWNRFSLFGCKYRLMPDKAGLRRLIRGSHFVGRMLAAVIFAGLGVAAGAVLVAGSVVILPGYGIIRLRRRMWAAKQRKKFHRQKMKMIGYEKHRVFLEKQFGNLETVVEESETEMSEPVSDPQQVQVMVHHAEGRDEIQGSDENKDCDIFVNKYTVEDPDVAISRCSAKGTNVAVDSNNDTVTYSDVKDVSSEGKYTKVVFDVVVSVKDKQKDEEVITTNNKAIDTSATKHEDLISDKKNEAIVEVENKLGNSNEVIESAAEIIFSSDHNVSDAPKKQSLSKGKNSIDEKISKTKVLRDNDKNPIPDKLEGETVGKGCFGNIFSVAKRTSVVTSVYSTNDDDIVKSEKPNRQKVQSLTVKKAATWEKCRRSKVEIDPGLKSSVDSVNDCNNFPLLVHKSASSFSSIIGFSFVGDEFTDEKKEGDSFDCLSPSDCDPEGDEYYSETINGDIVNTQNNLEDASIDGDELEIAAAKEINTTTREHLHVPQVSVVTHL